MGSERAAHRDGHPCYAAHPFPWPRAYSVPHTKVTRAEVGQRGERGQRQTTPLQGALPWFHLHCISCTDVDGIQISLTYSVALLKSHIFYFIFFLKCEGLPGCQESLFLV